MSVTKFSSSIAFVARLVLAAVFTFSGFVKIVDPWGTAIKFGEYFNVYGIPHSDWLDMALSILMSGAELAMGIALLFGLARKLLSYLYLIVVLGFTLITLLSATLFPIGDCGCFGDAIKLTVWQTFYKNLVLLALSTYLFFEVRANRPRRIRADYFWLSVIVACAFTIGIYSYLHLPLIDFLPYKTGINLREEVLGQSSDIEQVKTTLIYRNLSSGKLKEFELTDREWQDSEQWEWVETKVDDVSMNNNDVKEFALYDIDGKDVTSEIISTPGELQIVVISNMYGISQSCRNSIIKLLEKCYDAGGEMIVITPQSLEYPEYYLLPGLSVPVYNIDSTTIKSFLRASVGVVELRDGIINSKKNCRDI